MQPEDPRGREMVIRIHVSATPALSSLLLKGGAYVFALIPQSVCPLVTAGADAALQRHAIRPIYYEGTYIDLIIGTDHALCGFVESQCCSTYSGKFDPRSPPREHQGRTLQRLLVLPSLSQDACY